MKYCWQCSSVRSLPQSLSCLIVPLALTFSLRSLFGASAYDKTFGDNDGEGLASGNGSSHAVSGDQGTRDVHGDLQGAILISESFSSPNPIHTPSTPAAASFEGAGGEGGGGVAGFATGSLT